MKGVNMMKDTMKNKYMPITSVKSGIGVAVLPDVYCFTNQIVNICFVGTDAKDWVLIDAGMPESTNQILTAVEDRFGENSKPKAIILTHGHFDHTGGIVGLIKKWNISVYTHEQELPYVTGQKRYPEPDGTVEGGLVAKMSPLFPKEPVNLGDYIEALPPDGSVPHLPRWRWIHTPGHAPGHISLFREEDRTLIAGDAFVTVRQDSLYKVLSQTPEVNGPPRYLTTDWDKAEHSVEKLISLQPRTAISGHGQPMSGHDLSNGLTALVNDFASKAIPDYGRYVKDKQ